MAALVAALVAVLASGVVLAAGVALVPVLMVVVGKAVVDGGGPKIE